MKSLLRISILSLSVATTYSQKNDNDVKSVQNALDAYYESISGPIGKERDFDRLRNLFHPEARLIYSYWTDGGKKVNNLIMTPDEMIGKLGYTVEKGFYEKEIINRVASFSTITQVFSTYKFWTEDKTISGQGITSYEFVYDGERYWIMSMLWTAENEDYRIPEKYLNESK